MNQIKRRGLNMAQKDSLAGWLFVSPFVIGCIFFFLSPMVLYIKMGFSQISLEGTGMRLENVGFDNYYDILFVQTGYLSRVFESLGELLITFPAILLFSFFIATLLNRKFIGRTVSRAIFFLPVLIASGVAALGQSDALTGTAITAVSGAAGDIDGTVNLSRTLMNILGAGVDQSLFSVVEILIDKVYFITMNSGVQILIFLAGLQTISPSLYEVANIEGATGWECFWKITLPMISPIILVNAVYTVVDVLGRADNPIITDLYQLSIHNFKFGTSSAMGTIYFLVMFAVLGLVIFLMSKVVFYEEK